MNKSKLFLFVILLLLLSSALTGCGGKSTPEVATQPVDQAATSVPALPTLSSVLPGAVSSLQDVKTATIQIQAEGTFLDPAVGLVLSGAGRGSGLIIDPSGLAITNNHVVTGAGLLKVWIGGEAQSRNARILGVSECSDLALIDIDGDGYPFLSWHSGAVDVGLEVYAAGFPLGDPEFTLTKGIVSKARTSGAMSWASVTDVLEHDATINPGNSGGPLIDADGKVVGVNFAGSSGTGQFFAIKQEEVNSVLDQLKAGQNVNSIGVNGQAVLSEDGSIAGIWVASIASGSIADKSGLQAGDIITLLEGVLLGQDGTMSAYCDILRTHNPDDVLSMEVLRYASGEVLTGQLNGRELETSFVFDPGVGDPGTPNNQTGTYSGYVLATDDYSAINVEIPAEWAEIDGSPWVDGGDVIGASIYAAPSLDGFVNSWGTPGVIFNASDDLARLAGYQQLLDLYRADYIGSCKLDARYDYNDGFYRGKYDWFDNCGGPGGASFMLLTAVPIADPTSSLILVQVQMVSSADVDVAQHILDTFQIVGVLP
ncbi:MAG: trypsin-like serine protease [Anaerolineales bacterium]|nr:MAG: trypsin-like serine protease [Anaerolineales bacterium]